MESKELPTLETKQINGVNVTNLEIAKIAMVCDYLVLDRFQDLSSFLRFEKCFGPLFSNEKPNFLFEVFQEICGHKKKYITFGRLISAYLIWKSHLSKNEDFNKFMSILFNKMIKKNNEVVGIPVEKGKVFSTRNARGRKVISKFSVLSDIKKNAIKGFHIQYDDVFVSYLRPKNHNDKEVDSSEIKLEINFGPNGSNIRDRDGISHIGGKYSKTKNIIKFLIFKCRSGKTFYIGDNTEEKNEQIELFLFGTSSCQLKSLRIELVNDQLMYFEPKFQPSTRINQKIVPFDLIDDKFIDECINNAPLIFEENELSNIPLEEISTNSLLVPCISDDAFIDKNTLVEAIPGKDFNEIYKSFILVHEEMLEGEKEELKKKIYSRTVQRKQLLKVYMNKFKIQENIRVLKGNKEPEDRINQDKFLAKVKLYRKKLAKKVKKKKEDLKKSEYYMEEEEIEDDDDWIENEKLKNEE
jgi:hypothetical protein